MPLEATRITDINFNDDTPDDQFTEIHFEVDKTNAELKYLDNGFGRKVLAYTTCLGCKLQMAVLRIDQPVNCSTPLDGQTEIAPFIMAKKDASGHYNGDCGIDVILNPNSAVDLVIDIK